MTRHLEATSSEDQGLVLATFRRVLTREINVLRRRPALLWQQLYNRLQWEDEPVRALLEPEFKRRSIPGVSPWLRTRTRSRESEILIRTFEGHTEGIYACAYSPDGTRVVSASADATLKLWDTETGREVRTLEGHTGGIYACAYSPDGTRVVSASADATLKLWDTETGQEVHTLGGHTRGVLACAFSPDGIRVVSAGHDRTLKLWDTETGRCLATLPLLDFALTVAYHPLRESIACGDRTGSFYLVDLIGIAAGPLAVTAMDLGDGPSVRCPVCLARHPLQEVWLGREMDCPGSACQARLRVNPFVARRARRR